MKAIIRPKDDGAEASWWRMLLARALGKRVENTNNEYTVIGYKWRGCLYVTDVRYK